MSKRFAEETSCIGRRIRFLEPRDITERWKRNAPNVWVPTFGMQGTIVDLPPPGTLGSGPRVRWDNGFITWVGSGAPWEFVS